MYWMDRIGIRLAAIGACMAFAVPAWALSVEEYEQAIFSGAEVRVSLRNGPDSTDRQPTYVYEYTLINGSGNTLALAGIEIESLEPAERFRGDLTEFTIDAGAGIQTFAQAMERFEIEPLRGFPEDKQVTLLGTEMPEGWGSLFTRDGALYVLPVESTQSVQPGGSKSGLIVRSRYPVLPKLRRAVINPVFLVPVEDAEDPDEAERARVARVREQLTQERWTLAPMGGVTPLSQQHMRRVVSDVQQMEALGWLDGANTDPHPVTQRLEQAYAALREERLGDFESVVDELDAGIGNGRYTFRRSEVDDYLRMHVVELQEIEEPPDPVDPQAVVSPATATGTLDAPTEFLLAMRDENTGRLLGRSWFVEVEVRKGDRWEFAGDRVSVEYRNAVEFDMLPDTFSNRDPLDGGSSEESESAGEARIARIHYQGRSLGTDKLRFRVFLGFEVAVDAAFAEAEWRGAADLVVPLFTPEELLVGAEQLNMWDTTLNQGNIAAPPTRTEYRIRLVEDEQAGPWMTLGSRAVAELGPDRESDSRKQRFQAPGGPEGATYELEACADADDVVPEADETNNCSTSPVRGYAQIEMAVESRNVAPLVCDEVLAAPARIWPPNHKFVQVSLVDESSDTAGELRVSGVFQSEPVDEQGDGATQPDARILDGHTVEVRAERSGKRAGRAYYIEFEKRSELRPNCTGEVVVLVAHDQGGGRPNEKIGDERYPSL